MIRVQHLLKADDYFVRQYKLALDVGYYYPLMNVEKIFLIKKDDPYRQSPEKETGQAG